MFVTLLPGSMLLAAACSRKEPEARQQLGTSYLDDHLAATSGSTGWYFKMEQELWALPFVLVLLRTAGLCLNLQTRLALRWGVPHSPRMFSIQIKNSFSFLTASAFRVCLLWPWAAETLFLFGNSMAKETLIK